MGHHVPLTTFLILCLVIDGEKGGLLQFDRINGIYLNYMLDCFTRPRNLKIPQAILDFFTTIYINGGERLIYLFRGEHKLVDNPNQVKHHKKMLLMSFFIITNFNTGK